MSNSEELTRENVTLRNILIAVGTLAVGALFIQYVYNCIPEPWESLSMALAETLCIVGLVSMFYDLFLRRRFKVEMKHAVLQALNADVGLLKDKKLKDDVVDSFMKNCLEAKLCSHEMAERFFDGLISPAISLENHRKTFDYTISLVKLNEDTCIGNATFGKASYFRMTEDLTFKKPLNLTNGMELAVAVCFYEHQIAYYRDKECIYRTILNVKETERNKIKCWTPR